MNVSEKKGVVSWALYDWANSAFATTIIAGFFPLFFKQYWSVGVDTAVSTARLGLANSLAGVAIALAAPVLGAIADRGTSRKRFLIFFALMGIAATSAMALVPPGAWVCAVWLYLFASIGFSGGNVFYDSLLPGVSPKNREHFVSALGFALGYLGGGVLFALNVWMTLRPSFFGFADSAQAVRFSFLSVGIWWAVFAVPLMMFVNEPGPPGRPARGAGMVRAGVAQLGRTFREIRHHKMIFLFLAAYWLYIDGVDTIIKMAVDYGLSLGFQAGDLILALLITQFVGFPCAIAFGLLGQRIGAKRAILAAIGVYLFVSVWGGFIRSKAEFYALAIVIGFVQGGVQALSRSFYSRIIPEGRSAEYFGFYNMLGKFAAIIGPVLVGLTGLLARSMGASGALATRLSIVSLTILFLSGGILLLFVDEEQGRQEAARLAAEDQGACMP